MGFGGSSGGSASVAGSADVALNNPATNQVLTYDATITKWKNAPVTGTEPTLENIPAGSVIQVSWSGSAWGSRPTNRTDVVVWWIGGPALAVPAAALVGDVHVPNMEEV